LNNIGYFYNIIVEKKLKIIFYIQLLTKMIKIMALILVYYPTVWSDLIANWYMLCSVS